MIILFSVCRFYSISTDYDITPALLFAIILALNGELEPPLNPICTICLGVLGMKFTNETIWKFFITKSSFLQSKVFLQVSG